MEISIAICAHNPRPEYLSRVLRGLEAQTLARQRWELIIVDNASDEPLEGKHDLRWHPDARCVREEALGLTSARLHGIREARGELLIFVDDDNVLAPDYLASALEILHEYPWLGTFGASRITPLYEESPRPELERYCCLAIRNEPRDRFTNLPTLESAAVPFGAGMCVRASVAREYVARKERGGKIFGRKGQDLTSSDDLEFSLVATDCGLGYGIFHRLSVTHLIPSGRVKLDYLLRLNEGMQYSNALLRRLHSRELGEPTRSPIIELAMLVNVLLKTLAARGVHRKFEWRSGRGRVRALLEFRRSVEGRLDLDL
jgi:glycosyltransferase involved in cell wall biosynthesis